MDFNKPEKGLFDVRAGFTQRHGFASPCVW